MASRRLRIAVLALLATLAAARLLAAAAPADFETVRTRGMGGACTAVADDQQALFINPAGLFQVKENRYALVDVAAQRNLDSAAIENDLKQLSDDDTPAARRKNSEIMARIAGRPSWLELSNHAWYLGADGFGFGFLVNGVALAEASRPTRPQVRVTGRVDSLLSGSLSREVRGMQNLFSSRARLHWGGTLKFLSRRSLDKLYVARDFPGLSENDLRRAQAKGATGDLDAGLHAALAAPWAPTLGIHVENLLESEIDPRIGNLPRRCRVGCSLRPLEGPPERQNRLLLAMDVVDIWGGGSPFKRILLGAEARRWPRPWSEVRAGVRGGYLTFGCSGRFRLVRLDYATWAEELGRSPGDREDRRHSLALGLEF